MDSKIAKQKFINKWNKLSLDQKNRINEYADSLILQAEGQPLPKVSPCLSEIGDPICLE